MSFADVLTESITVYHPSTATPDEIGELTQGFESAGAVSAFVGHRRPDESLGQRGDLDVGVREMWFMVGPTADISQHDRIGYDGELFEVIGEPQVARRPGLGVHHKVVIGRAVESVDADS